jgi:mRNA-degrading endonuclease toxin of MazEF toxin-antitoxin module
MAQERHPSRGEIWFVQLPTDPPEKGLRPVVIISLDVRNRHPKASTVLVAPLTTTQKNVPTHIHLAPGETGLKEGSSIRAEDVSVVLKTSLREPREKLRTLSNAKICEVADAVRSAMGCPPK